MKKYFLILILILSSVLATAQTKADNYILLKNLEVYDSTTKAKVVVVNHVPIELIGDKEVIDGYRIRIFFDNSQTAREEILKDQIKYNKLFPKDTTYVEYDAPYFRLTAGNFLNHEEAQIKLSNVVPHFRSAFIVSAKIPVFEFLKVVNQYSPVDTTIVESANMSILPLTKISSMSTPIVKL